MANVIIVIITVVLSAMGLADLMHRFYIRFIAPKNVNRYILLPLKEGDSVSAVSAALDELRWYGRQYAEYVICVDVGMGDELRDIISRMAENNDNLIFCEFDDIKNVL